MHYLFGVDEHAIRNGVVVADDRVDEFVHERIGLEAEPLQCVAHERLGASSLMLV
jgi:hypothetical protein